MVALAGPTGIGKTRIAVELARRLQAEIVAVDSMQVYRGMDVGTGKPSFAERREVPHHGLDLVGTEEEFHAVRYVEMVGPAIREIKRRGKWALLVGGCGLYLRALLRGLSQAPGRDPAVREKLTRESLETGTEPLHARLSEIDPVAASRIHPRDARRIIRALEVHEVSGRTLSEWNAQTRPAEPAWGRSPIIGMECDREWLYGRIRTRVEEWLAEGWLEEARSLLSRPLSQTAREALGYRELFEHLEGRRGWQETKELIRRNTCRYAKRQRSWFRHEPGVHWVQVKQGANAGENAEAVLGCLQETGWNERS